MEAVVGVLQKADGRDVLLKFFQNSAGLRMWGCEKERREEWRGVMLAVLDARALLWMGRSVVQIHRLRGVRAMPAGVLRTLLTAQICCSATYFIVDNYRWLMKYKVLPRTVNVDRLRARNRYLQIASYVFALLAEVLRHTTHLPSAALSALLKALLDVLNATLPYLPHTTYQPNLCGLASSILALRSIYSKSIKD